MIGITICNTSYVIESEFSKGASGIIYNLKDNKKKLVKILPIKRNYNKKNALSEISFMTRTAAMSISPKIYNAKFCKIKGENYAFIIMEKYGNGTLEDMFEVFNEMKLNNKELQNIGKKISTLLDNLYKLEIIHGDLHARNILYKIQKSGKIEFRFWLFQKCNKLWKL